MVHRTIYTWLEPKECELVNEGRLPETAQQSDQPITLGNLERDEGRHLQDWKASNHTGPGVIQAEPYAGRKSNNFWVKIIGSGRQ